MGGNHRRFGIRIRGRSWWRTKSPDRRRGLSHQHASLPLVVCLRLPRKPGRAGTSACRTSAATGRRNPSGRCAGTEAALWPHRRGSSTGTHGTLPLGRSRRRRPLLLPTVPWCTSSWKGRRGGRSWLAVEWLVQPSISEMQWCCTTQGRGYGSLISGGTIYGFVGEELSIFWVCWEIHIGSWCTYTATFLFHHA